MKKRRIMAAMTAFAVAAAGLFAPAEFKGNNNGGLNIEASAAYTDEQYQGYREGGLELVYLKNGTTPDYDYDLETLGEGDYVKLIVKVPDLTPQLDALQADSTNYPNHDEQPGYTGYNRGLDTAKFTIKYDKDVFELTKWYNNEIMPLENTESSNISWDYIGDVLHGSNTTTDVSTLKEYDENTGTTKEWGTLYVNATTNSVKVNGCFFKDSEGNLNYLEATFKVKANVPKTGTEFSFLDNDADDIDFNVLDKNGENPVQLWKPDADKTKIEVKVTNYLNLFVSGYTPDDVNDMNVYMFATYLNDKTQIKPGKLVPKPEIETQKTVKIGGTDTKCGIYTDGENILYKSGSSYYDKDGKAQTTTGKTINKATIYKFKGIDFPKTSADTICYKFFVDKWCTYNNPIQTSSGWTDNATEEGFNIKIKTTDGQSFTVGKYSTDAPVPVKIRLFGDVDGVEGVRVTDATLILKHLVGRKDSSGNAIIDSEGTNKNEKYANVLKYNQGSTSLVDDKLNTRDATQILRFITDYPSIFTTKLEDVKTKIQAWETRAADANGTTP